MKVCQLCLKEKEKLCRAHLIPKSFIRAMYPEGKIEGESLWLVQTNKDYIQKPRVGIYDEDILCSDCDQFLGREYDEFGKKYFLDEIPVLQNVTDKGKAYLLNADPSKLKLFVISVFWRFVISKYPLLEAITVPEKFSEKMREMIITGDIGDVNTISVIVTRFDSKELIEQSRKFFQIPNRIRTVFLNYWILYLPNGYKIYIKVDSRNQDELLIPVSVSRDRPVSVLCWQMFENSAEAALIIENMKRLTK